MTLAFLIFGILYSRNRPFINRTERSGTIILGILANFSSFLTFIFMVNTVLKFVACSRAAGLRISTSEVLDCLNQLKLVDMLDEQQFAAVLRANFAKSRREQFHFDRLYDLFFHELRQEAGISQAELLGEEIQNTLLAITPEQNGNQTLQAVLDFLKGDPLSFLEQMRQGFIGGKRQRWGHGLQSGADDSAPRNDAADQCCGRFAEAIYYRSTGSDALGNTP